MECLTKMYRVYIGVLQPATVLKMTGCFLVVLEAVISMCLKSDIYRKFIGKTLPLAWLTHDKTMHYWKQNIFCDSTFQ